MPRRMRIAQIMLYAVAGGMGAIALMWLLTPKLLPLQADFVEMTHEQLPPRVAVLLLALYKIIGASTLALGAGLALLTRGPFRQGDPWGRRAIALMASIWGGPYAFGAFQIGSPTFVVPLALTVLALCALAITRPSP